MSKELLTKLTPEEEAHKSWKQDQVTKEEYTDTV